MTIMEGVFFFFEIVEFHCTVAFVRVLSSNLPPGSPRIGIACAGFFFPSLWFLLVILPLPHLLSSKLATTTAAPLKEAKKKNREYKKKKFRVRNF